ncbi:MAG: RNA-directed DNA polymerase [Alphaproteobacteria bacterium]|nr:RNA-directed DNA polymerase [Alphaproteobacteria bacterium]
MKSFRCQAELVDPVNVWRAWRDFERGKRRRPDVAAFSVEAERHVLALADALASGRYVPGPYRLLHVVDPKRRIVAAAAVRDRVVHHAIHRVLAPRLNRRFIAHSYACLPNRGSHRAIRRFQRSLRRHRFVLQLDVRRYFYSIDRARLRALLHRRLPEPPLRELLDQVLNSGADLYRRQDVVAWLGWPGPMPPGRGLPIGNLTSQWWGNLYLDALDHLACRRLRIPGYQRYMDDFALFGDDVQALRDQRDQLAAWLDAERGLCLKVPDAEPRSCRAAHAYLGYRVTPDTLTLGPKARQRLPANLSRVAHDPERAAAVVQAYGAAWTFGV